MKLISLWEPWATLMAIGAKRIETRSWRTDYRGWLAIHASKGGLSKRELATVLEGEEFRRCLDGEQLSPGRIVAVVRLIDCLPMDGQGCLSGVFEEYPELDTPRERHFGDFSFGRWAWVTDELIRLQEPIPFTSRQGLVDIPAELRRQIVASASMLGTMPIHRTKNRTEVA